MPGGASALTCSDGRGVFSAGTHHRPAQPLAGSRQLQVHPRAVSPCARSPRPRADATGQRADDGV